MDENDRKRERGATTTSGAFAGLQLGRHPLVQHPQQHFPSPSLEKEHQQQQLPLLHLLLLRQLLLLHLVLLQRLKQESSLLELEEEHLRQELPHIS